jgi:hypothetical protein
VGRREELAGFVMEGVGDPPRLRLKGLVQPAERGVGFPKRPMRHLERRCALSEELTGSLGSLNVPVRRTQPRHGLQHRLLVNSRHVQNAHPLGKRLPSKLVSFLQRLFSTVPEIVFELAEVLPFEFIQAVLLHIHG